MKILRRLLIGTLGIFGLLLIWGFLIEPYRVDVEEEVAEIPALPSNWQGEQVGLISDLQIGMWWDNVSTIRRIVDQLVQQSPELVLITGDLVYEPGINSAAKIRQVVELIRPLPEAQISTYVVLGNHDYLAPSDAADADSFAEQLEAALEAAGISVLQNEAIAVSSPDSNNSENTRSENRQNALYLVGIGAHRPDQDAPLYAVRQLPSDAARVVFMHNPASFAQLPAGAAPFAVAGHTHGGQIRIPFTPDWTWMVFLTDGKPAWDWIDQIRGEDVRASGWIDGYGQAGNHLYINRGIGFSSIPIRFNCPPELTLFTLQRG
ncbi:MAG: metallophosphoesterase [Elainellaceae cyanobacterium]